MIISTESFIKELEARLSNSLSINDFLEEANSLFEIYNINESEYNKVVKHLRLGILDIERFVKVNECKPITNPRAFVKDGIPSDDGLLSNTIFGITKEERAGIYAYIDLHGWFIDPSCYKSWYRIDRNIKALIHGTSNFSITEKGELIVDPNGKTGIEFLRKNINKINFRSNQSIKRNINVDYLEKNRDKMFIQKFLVIPPYYRDKNTGNNKSIGLGGINKLYSDLIIATNALLTTQDFMFDASDAMNGRVQEIMLNIYNWFCGLNNSTISNVESNTGISGKTGILRRANMSKTSNYATRLVISASELKVEKPYMMKATIDKSVIPLAACMVEFKDFVTFHTRRFFDNEFSGKQTYPVYTKDNKLEYLELDSPEIYFSDDRIKEEMERFVHGYNNRFVPIEIPLKNTTNTYYMRFVGRFGELNDKGESVVTESIYQRRLTWCDIFFIATVEATRNKKVLITRFPIDKYTNQIATGIVVSSTKDTEYMYFNNTFYQYYPKIRDEDINTNTSNKFVDTCNLSNVFLSGMGGDYDGDQITCKGVYTEEANKELDEFINSKQNFIDFANKASKESTGDVIQSIYNFTKIIDDSKITKSIQF